ncbi:MAG: hypothetical protein GY801_50110 [bacterium]|nr:hypothetical protein [bacterium]
MNFGTMLWNLDASQDMPRQHLGEEFSPDEGFPIVLLPLNDKLVVWYVHVPDSYAYLSLFDDGQEQILQKSLDFFGPYTDAILATGFLNQNAILDLLICPTEVIGVGRAAERWKQTLSIFFDEHTMTTPAISLSAVDATIMVHFDDCDRPGDCWERRRDSLVMILPAWGLTLTNSALENAGVPDSIVEQVIPLVSQVFADEEIFLAAIEISIGQEQTAAYRQQFRASLEPAPGKLSVWSRMTDSDQPEQELYQVEFHQIQEQQVTLLETIDGSYHETSTILHSVIQKQREQENAPVPLLLNFSKRAPEYLCEEDEWFQFLEK